MADAKKKTSWKLEGSILTATFPDGEATSFDLEKLAPGFTKKTAVEQRLIAYGWKQIASDGTARSKDQTMTLPEIRDYMTAKFAKYEAGDLTSEKGAGGMQVKVDVLAAKTDPKELAMLAEVSPTIAKKFTDAQKEILKKYQEKLAKAKK